jgi:outer membrane protease
MVKKYVVLWTTIFLLMSQATYANFCNFYNSECLPSWACGCNGCFGLDISLYGGYIYGESEEIVYNTEPEIPQDTISQLDWKIRNLWVVGATLRKSLFCDRVYLSIDAWTKADASRSTMVDRDFLDPFNPDVVTDISESPDTHLKKAKSFDFEVGYDIFSFYPWCSEASFIFLAGYKYTQWYWKAYGGSFSYDSGAFIGEFPPGELIISYKQHFHIPYLGLKMDWQWDTWGIAVFGKYTHWARVKDVDFHALRDLTFKDKFKHAKYWILGAEAFWNAWTCLDLVLSYSYERLDTTRGDVEISGDGFSEEIEDGAGVNHFHHLVTFGVKASF